VRRFAVECNFASGAPQWSCRDKTVAVGQHRNVRGLLNTRWAHMSALVRTSCLLLFFVWICRFFSFKTGSCSHTSFKVVCLEELDRNGNSRNQPVCLGGPTSTTNLVEQTSISVGVAQSLLTWQATSSKRCKDDLRTPNLSRKMLFRQQHSRRKIPRQ